MTFRGWPAEALDFYDGLHADNSKAYRTANKAVYEQRVYAPMVELLAELEPEFGRGNIFRPYRDVRFSADKSPYKTAIAATLEVGGYIQLSANGLAAGSGMYLMAADQLARYRRAVDDDKACAELEAVVAKVESHGIEVTGHERLKSATRRITSANRTPAQQGPRGREHWPVGRLARHSQGEGPSRRLPPRGAAAHEWLKRHVGATTEDERQVGRARCADLLDAPSHVQVGRGSRF